MNFVSSPKAMVIAMIFHAVLALTWPGFAREVLEDDLQVDFTGELSSGSILSHNLTVICHTTLREISPTEGNRLNLTNVYPFLCTHIVFLGYVESGTGAVTLNQNPVETQPQLAALAKIKKQNKWMKLLLRLELNDIEFGDGSNINGVQQRNFMTSLYDILKNKGVDGIYVKVSTEPNRSTQFLQEICRQVREAGFVVALGLIHIIPKSLIPSADFISSGTSAYTLDDTTYTHTRTKHQTPHSRHHEEQLEILRLAATPATVVLSLTPHAALMELTTRCKGSQRLHGCCGLGLAILKEQTWPLRIGNAGSFSFGQNSSFVALTLCPGNWSFWRSAANKEVSMCNGEYWISFTDRIFLESLLGMIKNHGLGGVDVASFIYDDHNDGYCDTSNSSNKIRYPFFLHINQILSSMFPNTTRPLPSTRRPDPVPKLKVSQAVCELWEALESQGIAEDERHICNAFKHLLANRYCFASKETNFSTSSRLRNVPPQDEQGCSTTRFGMLGLSSPLCTNPRQPGNCHSICGAHCADLMGNAIESVKCVLAGLREPVEHYHRYWAYCETFATETVSADECAQFTRPQLSETKKDDSNILMISLTSGAGILLVVCRGLYVLFVRKRNNQPDQPTVVVDTVNPSQSVENTGEFHTINRLRQELAELGCLLDDKEFEIDYEKRLGNGCFGVVYAATVREKPAAVKALNENTDSKDIVSLLSEIKILSKIEPHPNIVSFLGHCIVGETELTINLFLEYCAGGALESYLREHRSDFGQDFKVEHLIRWSYQMANGMEYLTSRKIVHGDLAARNVLLDDVQVAKISDFGLSRNMYHCNYYMKKGREPLPWRWMSIEALRDMKFSSASDVWSYGVTLYEVFSLSSVPYAGLSYTPAFIDQLIVFNLRPGRPLHVNDYIYDSIIQPCWAENECDRPTFFDILDILRPVLEGWSSELGYSSLESQLQE